MTVEERKQAMVSSCCHVDLEKDDFFKIQKYTPLIATVRFPALFEASLYFVPRVKGIVTKKSARATLKVLHKSSH